MSAKDLVLRVLVVVTILWAAQVLKDGYKEIQERRLKNPDAAKVNVMDDVFLGVICFVGMLVAQLLFRQLFAVVARAMIPKKPRWSHTVWGAKVTRCCDSIFKCAYYCAMTAWCFALLKDEPWLPRLLGGRGETKACWTNYPFQEVSADLRRFYLTAVGYHCSEVVLLLLEVRHPDFWEMMLHHLVTCCLVLFSFGLNYLRVGSLVLLLHGITDIFINLSKALVDTSNTRLIVASYFALVVSYVWFRILVFPISIMWSVWVESIPEAACGPGKIVSWSFMNFGLFTIFLLHMYWFGMIIKIGTYYRQTGQARDLQSNLSSMDFGDKKRS
ncbi:unnamed protein product [Cladocopium goreaui]|uniref:Ceramide synthase hyl-1 n=1 Tax=Cladocopium goreaui TaxID=2562237 RepID=A0A9P1BVG7_9DINO|nr:unnamed protein product [Cladocopium goreaui]|mmetsp:Transcript_19975/g.44051  ORF Transcript_19975/g.44051 Transcript_19975/m.44051 type:complete len:329 (+) Transcript_19975:89-1075(+)